MSHAGTVIELSGGMPAFELTSAANVFFFRNRKEARIFLAG
jgi:hypothetical protein